MIGQGVAQGVSNKITGIPTPAASPTGLQQGQQQLDYMDTAFPGTTPWERLGQSSAMGGIASSAIQAQSALQMQRNQLANENVLQARELATRLMVTKQNNRVQAMGYGSPMGVRAAQAMMNLYDGQDAADYDTFVKQGREELPSKIQAHQYNAPTSAMKSYFDKGGEAAGRLGGSLLGDSTTPTMFSAYDISRAQKNQEYKYSQIRKREGVKGHQKAAFDKIGRKY